MYLSLINHPPFSPGRTRGTHAVATHCSEIAYALGSLSILGDSARLEHAILAVACPPRASKALRAEGMIAT